MHASDSIVVLTTSDRCDLFRAAVGGGADLRFDPVQTVPLESFLVNIRLGGATLCVIDEEHFYSEKDMRTGIDAYLDDPMGEPSDLRLLLVCSKRKPGDDLLRHYVGYCGIYDIICDCDGAEITNRLSSMLRRKNRRLDVLDLLREKELPASSAHIQVRSEIQDQRETTNGVSVAAGLEGLEIKLTIQIDRSTGEVGITGA